MAKKWPCKKSNLSIMAPLPEGTKFVSSFSGSKTVGSPHHTGFGVRTIWIPKVSAHPRLVERTIICLVQNGFRLMALNINIYKGVD